MQNKYTYRIVVTALFSALICAATILIQIPMPATGGYVNLGDSIILICAALMDPLCAVLAAGLGSCLADVMTGYVVFAPGTLIIKALMGLVASLILRHSEQPSSPLKRTLMILLANLAAEAIMISGYFLYESVFLGMGLGAAGSILGNIGQGAFAVIASGILIPILRSSPILMKLMQKTKS